MKRCLLDNLCRLEQKQNGNLRTEHEKKFGRVSVVLLKPMWRAVVGSMSDAFHKKLLWWNSLKPGNPRISSNGYIRCLLYYFKWGGTNGLICIDRVQGFGSELSAIALKRSQGALIREHFSLKYVPDRWWAWDKLREERPVRVHRSSERELGTRLRCASGSGWASARRCRRSQESSLQQMA